MENDMMEDLSKPLEQEEEIMYMSGQLCACLKTGLFGKINNELVFQNLLR